MTWLHFRSRADNLCGYRLHCGLFPHWQISALSCGNNVHALVPWDFAARWRAWRAMVSGVPAARGVQNRDNCLHGD